MISGEALGVVIVARDVTARKKIETELREAKALADLTAKIAEEAKSNCRRSYQTKPKRQPN
jgi:hypothetical protein